MKSKELVTIIVCALIGCITLGFIVTQLASCEMDVSKSNAQYTAKQEQWYKDNGYIKEWSGWSGYTWKKEGESNEQ